MNEPYSMFDVTNQVIALTGGAGVLGSEMACALAEAGAKIAILDMQTELHESVEQRLKQSGTQYEVFKCDVLNPDSIQNVLESILKKFGKVDVLINGAGGNHPKATTSPEKLFFDIPADAFNWVLQLNLTGTVLPSQIFGKYFQLMG